MSLTTRVAVLVATPLVVFAACTAFDEVPAPRGADDAGADAADPATAQGFLPRETAAKVCSLVAECPNLAAAIGRSLRLPLAFPRWSYCMQTMAIDVDPSRVGKAATTAKLSAIAASASCAGALSQLGEEPFEPLDPRCKTNPRPPTYCLDALTVVDCHNSIAYHCNQPPWTPQSTCVSFDGGAWCGVAKGCTASSCENGVILYGCGPNYDQDVIQRDVQIGIDCTAWGETCRTEVNPDFDGGSSSVRNTSYCIEGKKPEGSLLLGPYALCEGDTLVQQSYAYSGYFDCSSLGGHCVAAQKGALCTYPSDECTPFDDGLDECNADVLTMPVCIGGKRSTFSCATIGKKCVSDATKPIRSACR